MKENEESCNLNGIFKINYYSADMCTKANKVLWYSHKGGKLSNSIYSQLMPTHFKWENEEICGGF